MFFLSQAGKRKAEQDKLVGTNFYEAIARPEDRLDLVVMESKIEGQVTNHSNSYV